MIELYTLENLGSEVSYVGQTSRNNYGNGRIITSAKRKYGKDFFTKTVLTSTLSDTTADFLEKFFIGVYRNSVKNYNISDGGVFGCRGYKHTAEHIAKITGNKYALGSVRSNSHKLAVSRAMLGNTHTVGYIPTETTRKAISAANKGKVGYMLGKTHSPETKAKISQALVGRVLKPMSVETKAKLSAITKAQMTPEAREHLRSLNLGKTLSNETKAKIRDYTIAMNNNPEHKAKVSLAVKGSKWMNKDGIRKRVLAQEIDTLLSAGWVFGRNV